MTSKSQLVGVTPNSSARGLTSPLNNPIQNYTSTGRFLTLPDSSPTTQTNVLGTTTLSPSNPTITFTLGLPTIDLQIPTPQLAMGINSSEIVFEADEGP